MYIFTIDAERYDESSLNIVQIESLINKHRNIIGKIKKIRDTMKESMT